MNQQPGNSDVIFELIQFGRSVKVTAIDPVSMLEVSIVGDSNAGAEALKSLAARKLFARLAKE